MTKAVFYDLEDPTLEIYRINYQREKAVLAKSLKQVDGNTKLAKANNFKCSGQTTRIIMMTHLEILKLQNYRVHISHLINSPHTKPRIGSI